MTGVDPTLSAHARHAAVAAAPSERSVASSRALPRLIRLCVDYAWVHVLALFLLAVFLFPFAYMFGTSLKTEEELTISRWFPTVPTFVAASPRVRDIDPVAKPAEAPAAMWDTALPVLREM